MRDAFIEFENGLQNTNYNNVNFKLTKKTKLTIF